MICRLLDFSADFRLYSVVNATTSTESSTRSGTALVTIEARRPLRRLTCSITSGHLALKGPFSRGDCGGDGGSSSGSAGGGSGITSAASAIGEITIGLNAGTSAGGDIITGVAAATRELTSHVATRATSVCT